MATPDDANPRPPLRLGWLSTGRGPGSRALLAAAHSAISDGSLNAVIDFALCTRAHGEAEGSDQFLAQAQRYGLTTISLSTREYRSTEEPAWRDRYNADLLATIRNRPPVDALVFAGLMLIVSDDIVNEYAALNLHPALPGGPIGAWQDVIWDLVRQQADETGVMVQVSTSEVDAGPVIAYCRFGIRGPDFADLWDTAAGQSVDGLRRDDGESHPLFARIRQEGLRREPLLLAEALRLIADGHVQVSPGAAHSPNGQPLAAGLDMTDRIENLLADGPAS